MSADARRERRRRRASGQALVEFSLVSLLLMTLFLGIMDFSFMFAGRVTTTNAVRWAARYAAVNPTNWTAAASPGPNTIEGQLRNGAVPATIPNTDAAILIQYLDPLAGSAGTVCGHYSVAGGGTWVSQNGYTKISCVVPNHVVTIKATYTYSFMTPMLSRSFGSVSIASTASEIEET